MEKSSGNIGEVKKTEIEDVEFEEVDSGNEKSEPPKEENIKKETKDESSDKKEKPSDSHDFMKSGFTSDFVKKKTKTSDNEDHPGHEEIKSTKEEKISDESKRIRDEEDANDNSFTKKDFENIADIVIEVIDAIASNSLKFWAGDSSERAYQLPDKKKSILSSQLSMILIKYQAKFPLEWMFLITIVAMYWGSWRKAKRYRKHKTHNPDKQRENEKSNKYEKKPVDVDYVEISEVNDKSKNNNEEVNEPETAHIVMD